MCTIFVNLKHNSITIKSKLLKLNISIIKQKVVQTKHKHKIPKI